MGHSLKLEDFASLVIHPDISESIRSLRRSSTDYGTIKMFAEEQNWHSLSTDTIFKIVNKSTIQKFSSKNDQLITEMQQRREYAESNEQTG
jgi:hypothetical protein